MRRSSAYTIQRCVDRSSEASPAPYSPGLNVAFGRRLTALVTNTRSPQTIGLECASPGIGTRQRMFSPVFTFQMSGSFIPSATPVAPGPRNDGHASFAAGAGPRGFRRSAAVRTILRSGAEGFCCAAGAMWPCDVATSAAAHAAAKRRGEIMAPDCSSVRQPASRGDRDVEQEIRR